MDLDHPRVIKLVETHETENSLYFITEILTGGELFKRIRSKGVFHEASAVTVLKHVLETVGYLHSKGYMHRDIKPDNIMIATKGCDHDIKLIDFGLASIITTDPVKAIYLKCGTPGFVAPEMFRAKDTINYDQSCDIYSIGVLFYVL